MLEVNKVRCGYDNKEIVKGVSFSVERGKNLCIVGPNGCGKSTLLKSIANLLEYKGNITLDSKEISQLNRKDLAKNVALMSQEIAIIDNMLGDGDEISRIYINFCNPWPKDRHKKRRLTHPRQIEKYKKFLKDGSEIWFKTDDDELFDESLEYFKECNLETKFITRDLHNSGFEGNVVTEHERMFTEQGIKTKFIILQYNK